MRRTQLKVPARTLCPGDYPFDDPLAPPGGPAQMQTDRLLGAAESEFPSSERPVRTWAPRPIRLVGRLSVAAAVAIAATIAVALVVPLAGCGTTYTLPDRETPVEVWVEAPAAATAPVETNLLVYVGDRKAVDGPVRLAAGEVRRRVATLTMRGGKQDVSVVIGGRAVATENLKLEHRAWIVITLAGDGAKIASVDREPGTAR